MTSQGALCKPQTGRSEQWVPGAPPALLQPPHAPCLPLSFPPPVHEKTWGSTPSSLGTHDLPGVPPREHLPQPGSELVLDQSFYSDVSTSMCLLAGAHSSI